MKRSLLTLFVVLASATVVLTVSSSNADIRRHNNTQSMFDLDYYLNSGAPAGGRISSAYADGEICQKGDVEITVVNPTYQYRDGQQYPIHGDEYNNAANLFCKSKGLDYARNVQKVEGQKILVLEAHGNTFERDGHHTSVTSLTCYKYVNEPCTTFSKDMLRAH